MVNKLWYECSDYGVFTAHVKWDEDDCGQSLWEDFERDGHGLFEGTSISLFSPL